MISKGEIDMKIGGKTAIISGGASGLGEASARMLNGETIRLDGAMRMSPQ